MVFKEVFKTEDRKAIDIFKKKCIALILIRKRKHLLSPIELHQIEEEAGLIYKMIKEGKEEHEENGITYHLSKDVKEYFKEKLFL